MTIDYWYELYKSYVEICVFLLSVLKQQQQITPQNFIFMTVMIAKKSYLVFRTISKISAIFAK